MFHTEAFWLRTLRLNPPLRVPLAPLPLGGCRLRSTAVEALPEIAARISLFVGK